MEEHDLLVNGVEVTFNCPSCGEELRIDAHAFEVDCPNCGKSYMVCVDVDRYSDEAED